MAALRPRHLKKAIAASITRKRPMMIWGPPGVGKSDMVRQVAHDLHRSIRDVRLTLLDSVDLRGFPYRDEDANRMHFSVPPFLPTDPDADDVLFLDEINAAEPQVQAAAYQLILDRKLGEYRLPDQVTVIAAGNRETDQSVVHTMSAALANRFIHVEAATNLDDWRQWARTNGIDERLLSFLAFRPGLLHDFDADKKAFPTPRSWEFANDMINATDDAIVDRELISGTVGEGAAAEFLTFCNIYQNLPDVDELLKNPGTASVPEQLDVRYALCGALSHRATEENFENLVKYVKRLPQEFQVLCVRDAVVKDRMLSNHPSFGEWAVENADVMV